MFRPLKETGDKTERFRQKGNIAMDRMRKDVFFFFVLKVKY